MKYRNVASYPLSVSSGANVAPGQDVTIDRLDQHDQAHIDAGRLMELPTTRTSIKDKDGDS